MKGNVIVKKQNLLRNTTMAVAISGLFLLGLVGCNLNESKPSTSTATGADGKFNPPVEANFVTNLSDDVLKNVLVDGMSYEKNIWNDLYEKELGVKVKYKWIAKNNEDYTSKLNLSFASGDIPDIMIVSASQLKQINDSDLAQDLKITFEKETSELTKNILTKEGNAPFNASTFDGKLIGLPCMGAGMGDNSQFIWMRTDWLKKLNLTQPKTMDDVLKISTAFTKQDPDGNGKNDTFGLAITKDLYGVVGGLEGFFAGFHAYPNKWIKDSSGNIVYGGIQPEVKDGLKRLNEMYKRGEIDPEFLVKAFDKIAEAVSSEKVGMTYGAQFISAWPLAQSKTTNKNADWNPYLIVSNDNKPAVNLVDMPVSSWYIVNKHYKHPEVLVRMMNVYTKFYTEKYGEYGDKDGKALWKLSPINTDIPGKNQDDQLAIDTAYKTGDMSKLNIRQGTIYKTVDKYIKDGNIDSYGFYKIFGPGGPGEVSQAGVRYYKEHNLVKLQEFFGPPTKNMDLKGSVIGNIQTEAYIKIILGEKDINSFDDFVKQWKSLGGDDITKEANERMKK